MISIQAYEIVEKSSIPAMLNGLFSMRGMIPQRTQTFREGTFSTSQIWVEEISQV